MVRLLFDENFDRRVLRGIRLRLPAAELLTVQEAGLSGTPDPELLEWAAMEQRIMVSRDVQTMIGFAYDRVEQGQYLPGLFVVPATMPLSQVIEELVTIIECSETGEWESRVVHLPI